jgi:hypothetical protein
MLDHARKRPIAMLKLYCDESDDANTYALAGWIASAAAWNRFDPAWRDMLKLLTMPDGNPCAAFHAADIVSREEISDSPFRGWTFDEECNAFKQATNVIADPRLCPNLVPMGCAVELPGTFKDVERDAIWLILFIKLMSALMEAYPHRPFDVAFIFDEKPAIESFARRAHREAKDYLDSRMPGAFKSSIAFGRDQDHPPLQAADYFAYEWRKRITDARMTPAKRPRRSWARLRSERPGGSLWRYDRALFEKALAKDDQSRAWVESIYFERPSGCD